MLQCYNRGCGQSYDPEKNTNESCCHHPGEPFFHDAYKGWSCCNKKSVDFTEFLSIKGCTLSKHSNVKPEAPIKLQPKKEMPLIETINKPQKKESFMERPSLQTEMTTLTPVVAQALKDVADAFVAKKASTVDNSSGTEVAIGTYCKNRGCAYVYRGDEKDNSECVYHRGVAMFHEGNKFWSCCTKRTTDFQEFLDTKGCSIGRHKWFEENPNNEVSCRWDWYQTPTQVFVNIYGKNYHYERSKVEINPVRLHASLLFPEKNNGTFNFDIVLHGIINVKDTVVNMKGTKIEIAMAKAESRTWAALEMPKHLQKTINDKANNDADKTKKDSLKDDDDVDELDIKLLSEVAKQSPKVWEPED